MTKEELRKKIADQFLDWVESGALLDDVAEFPDDSIEIVVHVKGVEREAMPIDLPMSVKGHLVIGVRVLVDGKDRSERLGHGPTNTYDYIESSTT